MKWSREGKWITGGFMMTIALIGTLSIMSYQNATQLVNSAERVRRTNDILDSLTDVSATLAEAESRRWGYILFNDADELERYRTAVQRFDTIFHRLRDPLADTPIQQQRLSLLEQAIGRQLQLFQQTIELYQGRQTEISASDPLITQTKQNQDEINRLIAALEATEEELLQTQVEQAQSNLQFRLLIEPLAAVLTFGILLGVYALLYRQMAKRQRAESLQQTLVQEKKMSELKLQLFSMVSHEFRTPLSLILGSAQLLGETLKQQVEPIKLKNLYRIQSSAKMMTQLLSDILTLARADAGNLEYNPETVEIQTFCLNLIEDFQVFSENKRSIHFTQQGSCTHAYADEKLLYSVLSNLLSNAIKYSPPDSSIDFTLIREVDAIVFLVKDNGIGIAPEDQSQLYDPFSRGRNARELMGTGLGLAVVKRCLDLHQGTISVESQLGVGTTFIVRIPQERMGYL
ncbi:CHASE3 domain-containing protein [Oculatella sp. LEGE 06141]|uniref:sensor histidine kinase n=1 Tax=Oculatella sp. LEGE 06141 TaxID=1828648 RepID=UPI001880085C|nr:ATP-binding protein [Oculatella sp. LEGE 06141]MBE9181545.1 CHASE3 domain-containing protein [Oculatella sp. LEGE 06141]